MKKFYLIILFALSILASKAQIVLDFTQIAKIGDKYYQSEYSLFEGKSDFVIAEQTSVLQSTYENGAVYLSFKVTGDSTESVYAILKTENHTDFELVSVIQNIPTNINTPILYCAVDKRGLHRTTFYKLYKFYPGGKVSYIMTTIVPIVENPLYFQRSQYVPAAIRQ